MASSNAIIQILATIKTLYPYYAGDTDALRIAKVWQLTLNEYSDDELEQALLLCLQTCKQPPTPADLIEKLNNINNAKSKTAEEYWAQHLELIRKAMRFVRAFGYTAIDSNGKTQGENAKARCEMLWDEMPEISKAFFGDYSEFVRTTLDYANGENINFEKNRFIKAYPELKNTVKIRKSSELLLEGKKENQGLLS